MADGACAAMIAGAVTGGRRAVITTGIAVASTVATTVSPAVAATVTTTIAAIVASLAGKSRRCQQEAACQCKRQCSKHKPNGGRQDPGLQDVMHLSVEHRCAPC
jgi:hypothetical protein